MRAYHNLLRDVLERGRPSESRAKLASTGQHVGTRSLFGVQARYDLTKGFPLVTTKFVSFRNIAIELAWFLRGDTNVEYLRQRGVKIWDQWASKRGELGQIYGAQWRRWQREDPLFEGHDQIRSLVHGIKETAANPNAPEARRLIVTAWNPIDVPYMTLPPCHLLMQFDVHGGKLSCRMDQRSADLFLGAPYNIASYALLTHLLAQQTGLVAHELIHQIGNAHIYENHIEQVEEQLSREPYPLPRLVLEPAATVDDFDGELHARVEDYQHHPALRGEVAI